MEKSYGTKSSNETMVAYIKPRKPLMSKSERERQAKTLITYKPGGGDAS
jgi:hypothetical protein